jgi:hypothetical protein
MIAWLTAPLGWTCVSLDNVPPCIPRGIFSTTAETLDELFTSQSLSPARVACVVETGNRAGRSCFRAKAGARLWFCQPFANRVDNSPSAEERPRWSVPLNSPPACFGVRDTRALKRGERRSVRQPASGGRRTSARSALSSCTPESPRRPLWPSGWADGSFAFGALILLHFQCRPPSKKRLILCPKNGVHYTGFGGLGVKSKLKSGGYL